MRPVLLEDWNLEVVRELLRTGAFESESFDYKEMLPHAKNGKDKARLRRTCCAFANSEGGFIVFGVRDSRSSPVDQRIVGIDKNCDFPERFGNFPRGCEPTIDWTFRNPPLELEDSKVLHVVHIPKSWRAPHATGSRDTGWVYTKRTNKGNENMNTDEIRTAYLGYYEKRLKLQLLRSELSMLAEMAGNSYYTDTERISTSYSLMSFDSRVIESIIADTYSITAKETEFISLLGEVRQAVSIANNLLRIFFSTVNLPMSNMKGVVKRHNLGMEKVCVRLVSLCERALTELDRILN